MRKTILISAVFIFLLSACSTSKKTAQSVTNSPTTSVSVTDEQRDGSSYEKAIVIKEKSETPGVSAEYKWLKEKYPGYTFTGQSLSTYKKTPYDVIKIKTADGEEKTVYFDISNFFGKF